MSLLDCPDSIVSSVANDTPSAGQTTITLSGLLLTADAYNGLELRVVRPEAASNRLLYGEVLDTTSSTIVVQDDGSDSIYSALNSATQGFQVLDLPAAEASPSSTSGTWDLGAGYDPIAGTTSYTDFSAFSAAYIGMQLFPETDTYPNVSFTIIDVPNSSTVVVEGDTSAYGASAGDPYTIAERCWRYDSVNDESDYFDADASFAAFMVGWTFVPDISKPCYLPVIAVDAENGSITVKGDASGLAAPLENRYHLIPPAGVARSTGALCKPEDAGDSTWSGTGSYDDPGAKWLWSGYLYVTPQVGHEVSGTTYGAQSGTNHLGQYHCWNREYDPNQGRWTAQDPAASPWRSLYDYVGSSPMTLSDGAGLYSVGYGQIPGAPGKWGGAYIDPDALDLFRAWAQVMEIASGRWGNYHFPFFGGAKRGLIQGWTYHVSDSGEVYLKPWGGDWLEGGDVSENDVPPEASNKCHKKKDAYDQSKHRVENTKGLSAAEFCWKVYREVHNEQNAAAQLGGAARQEFKVVLSCDENGATLGTGQCVGTCDNSNEQCTVDYSKHKKRWLDRNSPTGSDIINDIAGGDGLTAFSLRDDWEMRVLANEPRLLQPMYANQEFATGVSCECK